MTALLQVDNETDPSPLTFLRRSVRVDLGSLSDADAARALRDPITNAEWAISDDALALAVVESHGYPYMVQLLGYHTWRQADAATPRLEVHHVQAGLHEARRDLRRQVLDEAMKPLSANDRRYLAAMAQDAGEVSSTGEVARRLEVAPDYANKYRERLIDRALIRGDTRGVVEWAIPMLADYVRDLTKEPEAAEFWVRTGRTTALVAPATRGADDLGELGTKINALRSQRLTSGTESQRASSDSDALPGPAPTDTSAGPTVEARATPGSAILQSEAFGSGPPHLSGTPGMVVRPAGIDPGRGL